MHLENITFVVLFYALEDLVYYAVMPELGGPGGPLAPPIVGRSVNPIQTGEGRLSPPTYYYWHPQCFSPSGITVMHSPYIE